MIEIAGEGLTALINPFGAELSHLRDAAGNELMTDADPAYWTGRAPLLFPIVGALNGGVYRHEGKQYALPQHGFARRRSFALLDQAPNRARFRLTDDEATRAVYPFAFALDADFAIEGATLTIAITVANRGDTEMPASFGFHPAFAWPLPYGAPREAHAITFDADEPDALRRVEGGTILPETFPSPLDGRTLHLADDLFTHDALIWDHLRSRSVTYGAAQGPRLEIAFPDTRLLGIWTKPGARFVCIEPWHGLADPQGFTSELRDKPWIEHFAPGESRTYTMMVTLRG
ncbi:aldose 1-epimerase family protein [Sphingomonas sp.]|uniref:aldose 1-epimerase family protein n=1 Tax=Sphingomonas sp. TaxID=28214 RepID=UPI001B022CF5|nr:aldose 1-epimerase family protein [Sphingomonas sp.]MBO9712383.1 aldose 1-epimerase family protein [Sphingomonas sp.]